MTWDSQFLEIFRRSLSSYQDGNRDYTTHYSPDDLSFLAEIGYKEREMFDFVEDFADEGVPTESTALLVASVRRDYFLHVQGSQLSKNEVTRDELPSPNDQFEGLSYLPRIIAKAEAKLRGELHPDLMFSCGGDRRFLRENGDIHPADFLRHVWAASGDASQVAGFVEKSASS